jgi:D-serine deaminase-like pyridoxal phosphate-dependent protein
VESPPRPEPTGAGGLAEVSTPALIVSRSRLEANIEAMAARAARFGARLRPHAKTHKCAAIGRLQVDAGAVGLTVATIAEAEAFASEGFGDLLLAYPPVGPWRLERVVALARRVALEVLVDAAEPIEQLERACREARVRVGWRWEVDSGNRRLGTPPGRATAEAVAALASQTKHATFTGLLTFAGHAYAATSDEELDATAAAERDALRATARELEALGVSVPLLSAGTTPTSHRMNADAEGLELRPGNYVFYDATQVALGLVEPDACALSVLATVISRPNARRIILDSGSKALAAERLTPRTTGFGIVAGHPNLVVERLFEEHAIVTSATAIAVAPGERLRIIPNHACAAVNLHDQMLVVDEADAVVDAWPVMARAWPAQ